MTDAMAVPVAVAVVVIFLVAHFRTVASEFSTPGSRFLPVELHAVNVTVNNRSTFFKTKLNLDCEPKIVDVVK